MLLAVLPLPLQLLARLNPPAWVRWSVTAAYSIAVAWLMLAPSEVFVNVLWWFPHIDKLLHFLLYGFLVWLIRWAATAHCRKHALKFGFLTAACGAIAYGALMEIAQSLLAGYNRSFEWLDIASNSLGALCFWFLWDLASAWIAKTKTETSAPPPETPTPSNH